jgi:DnaK suppressor protein
VILGLFFLVFLLKKIAHGYKIAPPTTRGREKPMTRTQKRIYKNLLIKKLKELSSNIAEKRVTGLQEFEEPEADIYDVCSQSYSKEQIFLLCERDLRLLSQVEGALNKIETGNFGLCEQCESPINEKRLKAVPWVKYCIECQNKMEDEAAA